MSFYEGGIGRILISADGDVGNESAATEIPVAVDLISLDFTEDMFRNSIAGTIVFSTRSGWDSKLGSVNGTEWITIEFNSQRFDKEGNAETETNSQRFKAYKVTSSVSESGNMTTYAFAFTTFQALIDSHKLERHLSDQHIGPISTDFSADVVRNDFTNQDYGFVNKIFDHLLVDADITIESSSDKITNPDIEATTNWINYVPAYLDNRSSTGVLDEYWRFGSYYNGYNADAGKDSRPRKVFEILNELAENAISKENPNAANFFIWQDLRGWHFRSVDSYLRDRKEVTDVDRVYSYDITNIDVPQGTEINRIIDLQVTKQVDMMDLLASQALSSQVVYYELNPDNEFAGHYMSLPENLTGITKVIGPNGFQDGVGETLIEQKAIVPGGISYDYLLDYDKWSKVEAYPLLQDIENQYTDYTFPSFLEIPPAYTKSVAGNDSWFASAPYDDSDLSYRWYYSNRIGTELSFRVTNRAEYFKQQFLRQSDLEGVKFRTVHDKIKTPIIKALKEHYDALVQRLYFEHNLIIDNGLNTLEVGEGSIGRGDNGAFCDYCLDRSAAISDGESLLREILGPEVFQQQFVDAFRYLNSEGEEIGYDTLRYENSVLNAYLYNLNNFTTGVPYGGNYNVNDFDGSAFQTCTAKTRDLRKTIFGYPNAAQATSSFGFGQDLELPEGSISSEEVVEFYLSQPVIEFDNVARVDETIQGQSYPACGTDEPPLPYDGSEVDCVTIREKWEAIPSECALIREHLGAEYVSPIIRGDYGQPINVDNMSLWNGYWLNPKFGLPNRRNYLAFYRDLDINFSGSEAQLYAAHESNMFLKDFLPGAPELAGAQSQIYLTDVGGINYGANIPLGNFFDFTLGGVFLFDESTQTKVFGETHYSHAIDIRNVIDADEVPEEPEEGDTYSVRYDKIVSYIPNYSYNRVTTCSTPFLCGHEDVGEETISIPYVSEQTFVAEERGTTDGGGFGDPTPGGFDPINNPNNVFFKLESIETSTKSVTFPARWSRGLPYYYGNISNLPQRFVGYAGNFMDKSYIEFLRQFGIVRDDYVQNPGENFIIQEQNSSTIGFANQAGVAELAGTFRRKGIETAYFPNRALGFYDANRPIYHKKDWQNFLDCNGTCVGSNGDGEFNRIDPAKNKAVEYAKYCSYAWNRYWSTPKEQPMYRRAQVALIQSQEVEITVPNDMNLSIGNLVRLQLPKSRSLGKEKDIAAQERINPMSGRYLVTGIRRTFTGNDTQAMRVRLNRDSLPYDPNGS